MGSLLWMALALVAALGSALLAWVVAEARMQTRIARHREKLAEARSQLTQMCKTYEERVRAAQAEARRKALDDFLADVRVEERHYVRELDRCPGRRKCLVLEERVCFRNIPLTQWTERKVIVGGELASPAGRSGPQEILAAEGGSPRLLG